MRNKITESHYSWSQIDLFDRCARKYYYSRVLCLPQRPFYVMASGKAVHAALERHNKELAQGRTGLRVKELVECAVTDLEQTENVADMDVALPAAKDQLVKDAEGPLFKYRNTVEPMQLDSQRPFAAKDVEREFRCLVGGALVVGYLDVVLGSAVIVDYKFTGRRKSAKDVNCSGQLALYEHATGLSSGFVQLIRGREDAVWTPRKTNSFVTAGIMAGIKDTIRSIQISRETNHWPRCSPTSWMCGADSCEFFMKCFESAT